MLIRIRRLLQESLFIETKNFGCFAEKMDIAQVNKMVDKVWQARLATGDPLEALLHKEEVNVDVDTCLCLWCMLMILQLLTARPEFLPLCRCTGGEQD